MISDHWWQWNMKIRHGRPVLMIRTNSLIWNNIKGMKKLKNEKPKQKNELSLFVWPEYHRSVQFRPSSEKTSVTEKIRERPLSRLDVGCTNILTVSTIRDGVLN